MRIRWLDSDEAGAAQAARHAAEAARVPRPRLAGGRATSGPPRRDSTTPGLLPQPGPKDARGPSTRVAAPAIVPASAGSSSSGARARPPQDARGRPDPGPVHGRPGPWETRGSVRRPDRLPGTPTPGDAVQGLPGGRTPSARSTHPPLAPPASRPPSPVEAPRPPGDCLLGAKSPAFGEIEAPNRPACDRLDDEPPGPSIRVGPAYPLTYAIFFDKYVINRLK